jgi:predicted nucleotidyltransferase
MPDNSEYSRPAKLEDVKKVIQSLNENRAEYFLIGGYALFTHGYHRATEDIDLMIPVDINNAQLIKKALMILEDQESANLPDEWFDGEENIRLADEVIVDLIFKTCGQTYETLKPFIELVDLDGVTVKTLNLHGLLKTKQSDREKDQLDRSILSKVLSLLE